MSGIENTNIDQFIDVDTPIDVKSRFIDTINSINTVFKTRREIEDILKGNSNKKIVLVGPCSIHDYNVAIEYANFIKNMQSKFQNLVLVMRVYFEKPRTTIGWKGMVYDPDLDNTCDINKGLNICRKILRDINDLGVPAGSEILDTITPQYFSDLISWGAIGARTCESQIHRELCSGMSMPIGIKNDTNGNYTNSINSIKSASRPHTFPGISIEGKIKGIKTKGNKNLHLILRGGLNGPNYQNNFVVDALNQMNNSGINSKVMIDCSHGNSNKNYKNQPKVCIDICNQIKAGNSNIIGVMLESNLKEGKQKFTNKNELEYGVSITDSCIGLDTTEELLKELNNSVQITKISNKKRKLSL